MNLLTFLDDNDEFDVEGFKAAVSVVFTGQEIIVGNADYPTEKIGETTRAFRQLGIGYANLGALLMAQGLPYDSDAGRAWAAAITALLTGHAYATSARTAARMGPFAGLPREPASRCSTCCACTRPRRPASTRTSCRLSCCRRRRSRGTRRSTWPRSTACATRRPAFWRRRAASSAGRWSSTGRGLVRLRSLGDPDGAQWQDLETEVATDEGPRQATKFYVNGSEAVVTVETARGHRVRGTAAHRIKVVEPESGEWVWRRFGEVEPGELVPMALGSMVGEPQDVEPSRLWPRRTGPESTT